MSAYDKFYLLKSRDRTTESKSSSDFTIQLPHPINGKYELVSATVPNTIYTFAAGDDSNKIYFNEAGTPFTASITPGFYSTSTIAAAIKTAMEDVGSYTYTVTIDSVTQRVTISAGADLFILEFASREGASERLGFAREDTAAATSHTGDYVLNFALPHSLVVDIDRKESFQSSGQDSGSFYIPFDVNSSDVMIYSRDSKFSQNIEFRNQTSFPIQLKNTNNQIVDLNGANWEMLLKKVN